MQVDSSVQRYRAHEDQLEKLPDMDLGRWMEMDEDTRKFKLKSARELDV